jgi:hypothetical protein
MSGTVIDTDRRALGRLCCPCCGCRTESLKYYVFLEKWLFLLVHTHWELATVRACPPCVRRFVKERSLRLLLPAHYSWPFIVLPWALWLIACSYLPGHSYQFEHDPEYAARPRSAWRGKLAVVNLCVLCGLPVVGLVVSLVSYRLTRRDNVVAHFFSIVGLLISVVVHTAVVGLILLDQGGLLRGH